MEMRETTAIAKKGRAFVAAAVIMIPSFFLVHAVEQKMLLVSSSAQAKVLKSPEMGLLDALLQSSPIATVRLEFTLKAALKAIGELDKRDAAEASASIDQQVELVWLKQSIESILSPVREFFDEVHEHARVIKPLIVESIQSKESLLLKFFESPDKAMTFFENYAKTRAHLRLVCNEFITFIRDIRKSLSESSVLAARKIIEEIKNSKQTK